MFTDSKDFYDLIEDYLRLWPCKINVSQIFIEGNPSPFEELISAHDIIEEKLAELKNHKLWILDWSVFKYFNFLAKQKNIDEIIIAKINLELIESIYVEDIETWRKDFL